MNLRSEVALTKDAVLLRLQDAETYYKSLEKLEFRKTSSKTDLVKLKKSNTSESFVRKFFDKFNTEFYTYYTTSNNVYTGVDTRRSIGDIFRTAYSYLGNKITMKDIVIETYKRILSSNICSNYCYQINKRVYKERGERNGNYYDSTQYDELGLTKAHYQLLID